MKQKQFRGVHKGKKPMVRSPKRRDQPPRDQLRPVRLSRELTDRVGNTDDERSWMDD